MSILVSNLASDLVSDLVSKFRRLFVDKINLKIAIDIALLRPIKKYALTKYCHDVYLLLAFNTVGKLTTICYAYLKLRFLFVLLTQFYCFFIELNK